MRRTVYLCRAIPAIILMAGLIATIGLRSALLSAFANGYLEVQSSLLFLSVTGGGVAISFLVALVVELLRSLTADDLAA